jgi:excinuclease ABC subunit C
VKNQYRKFNIKTEDLVPGDDYGMMREVLTRRFKRLLKEHGLPAGEAAADDQPVNALVSAPPGEEPGGGEEQLLPPEENSDLNSLSLDDAEDEAEAQGGDVGAWPDLVMIDGGAGQLSAAQEVLAELGLHGLRLVAIAKGPDRNAGRERFFMPGKPPFSLEQRDPALYFVQRLRDEAHRFAIGSHRMKRKKAMSENSLDEIPGIGPSRKRALLKHFGSAKSVSRAGLSDLQAVAGISEAMAQQIYDYFHDRK